MPQEIELRLSARERDAARLIDSPAVARLASGPSSTAQLKTRYYDTPELAFARSGLSLRVRNKGRAFVQTVKTSGTGALLSERDEYETRVAASEPDIGRVADEDLRTQLLELAGSDPVEPKFETEIRRTSRLLKTPDGDEMELSVDTGEIRALANGGGRVPVSELELELKRGSPAALYDVARALAQTSALAVAMESKAERGLRLLEGKPAQASKAGRVTLAEDTAAEDAFRIVLLHCVRHIAQNVPAVDAKDPEGVHQMRVGLRRFRAAITCFGPEFRNAALIALHGRASDLADAFSATRELDVFAAELMPAMAPHMPEGVHAAPLLAAVDRLRDQEWADTVALVRSERFTGWLLDAAAAAERRLWRDETRDAPEHLLRPAVELAQESLDHRLHKAKKRARHLSQLDVAERHRLRIALKKLRYAAEFFSSLFPGKEVAPYLKRLSRVQDSFGAMNDGAMTLHVLQRIRASAPRDAELGEAAAFVAGWHLANVGPMWREAKKRWKRLAKDEPFWRD